MKFYEWRWWQRIFKKEEEKKKSETPENIEAIQDFLNEIPQSVKTIKELLKSLKELEYERQVATPSLARVNLEAQADIIEKLIDQYEFFQDDADINGIRVKRIAHEYLFQAKKIGLNKLVKEKKRDLKWRGW
ncbi:hypothetical protein HYT52_01860 [Candidatus Woesearchaeota archaeon]|nr:hypothetical protein [Candidatus Woesearchaeota archaeon]